MDKSAFVFPGQGSQYVGMGKHLYEQFSVAKETFEEANEVLGFSLSKLIFEGPLGELGKTENMQLALLVASTATFRVYMQEIGEEPHYLAGHSMGEYAALVCSEAFRLTDALAIVKLRGKLSQAVAMSGIGAMTVVNKAPLQVVERICEEASAPDSQASIACYNGWEQSVIAGHQEALIRAETLLAERNAELAPLMTSPPFHSPLMADVAEELGSELGKVAFGRFQRPVIANVTGRPYPGEGAVAELLTLQMTRPVQWLATMNYFLEHGVTTVVEMGPQAVLTNLFRQHAPSVRAVSFGQKDDRNAVLHSFRQQLAGTAERRTVVTECLAVAISTPNRNRDIGECELGIDLPYERIERMQEQLEEEQLPPTADQMREALEMLRSVLATKKVGITERNERFRDILRTTGTESLFSDFVETQPEEEARRFVRVEYELDAQS